jgi:hypothetical protein
MEYIKSLSVTPEDTGRPAPIEQSPVTPPVEINEPR